MNHISFRSATAIRDLRHLPRPHQINNHPCGRLVSDKLGPERGEISFLHLATPLCTSSSNEKGLAHVLEEIMEGNFANARTQRLDNSFNWRRLQFFAAVILLLSPFYFFALRAVKVSSIVVSLKFMGKFYYNWCQTFPDISFLKGNIGYILFIGVA